jgi:phosphate transport system substrate-binding protein
VRNPIANSAAPDGYPIAGLTFLLVYQQQKDPAKGRALVEFIHWAMHDGQEMTADLDYARLPDAVVAVNEKTLAGVSVGGQASR